MAPFIEHRFQKQKYLKPSFFAITLFPLIAEVVTWGSVLAVLLL